MNVLVYVTHIHPSIHPSIELTAYPVGAGKGTQSFVPGADIIYKFNL